MEHSTLQVRLSRALHWLGDLTSRAGAAVLVAAVLAVFVLVLVLLGFPATLEAGFSALASAITLLMVFVIQHTQSRQQSVTQLKLDELIRASPRADDLLVHLESADDHELAEREEHQLAHHASLRSDPDDE